MRRATPGARWQVVGHTHARQWLTDVGHSLSGRLPKVAGRVVAAVHVEGGVGGVCMGEGQGGRRVSGQRRERAAGIAAGMA